MKENVIPAVAEATIDCRLLPGEPPERFMATLRELVDDDKVTIEPIYASDTPASPLQTALYDVVAQVVREVDERAVVLPVMSSWFTDSRAFRRAGTPAYGFIPALLTPEDYATIHGHDERISIENVRLGCQVLFELTRRLTAPA